MSQSGSTKADVAWYLNSGDLSRLNLSYATWAVLMRNGVDSVEKLNGMSRKEMLGLYGVGPKKIAEIMDALEKWRKENE